MLTFDEKVSVAKDIITRTIAVCSSEQYTSYMKTKEFAYRTVAKYFSGENVLELGSDQSPTTSILVRWSDSLTIVDCEDKRHLKMLEDEMIHNASFIKSHWETYETKKKFSDILLTDSLEHVENPVQILKLTKKWLTKDGKLHIVVPNALSIHRLIGVEMGYLEGSPYNFSPNDVESGHLRVYDMNTLKNHVLEAGLQIEAFKGIQFKPMTDTQLASFPDEYVEALYKLGDKFPEYCAEIYMCCTL